MSKSGLDLGQDKTDWYKLKLVDMSSMSKRTMNENKEREALRNKSRELMRDLGLSPKFFELNGRVQRMEKHDASLNVAHFNHSFSTEWSLAQLQNKERNKKMRRVCSVLVCMGLAHFF